MVRYRFCTECKITKPSREFYNNCVELKGFSGICKECNKIRKAKEAFERSQKGTCLNCNNKIDKRKIYCNRKCLMSYIVKQWSLGNESTPITSNILNHIKSYLIEVRGESCEECGWNKIHPNTGKVPIDLHHKDGNSQNNKQENLILVCPNCHRWAHLHLGSNRGRGRSSLKKAASDNGFIRDAWETKLT